MAFFWIRRWMARFFPRSSRRWSNADLRRWAPLFEGDFINVSGWMDQDKEGGEYRSYFTRARSYSISNVPGERGATGRAGELRIDLAAPLAAELREAYDVVFNHTVLEHLFDIRLGVANLCGLSRDVVVSVTPFIQVVHWEPGAFSDYWRPTPFAMERMLGENGFEVVYSSHNDNSLHSVYLLTIASRRPERWRSRFPAKAAWTPETVPGQCYR
jgi:hypothetical protein